jgi:phosphoglycolate phosphatase
LQDKLGFQPKLVLLDLDGTLVDSAADIHIALNRALGDLGLGAVTEAQVRRWVGQGASRLIQCVLENGHLTHELHGLLLAQFMKRYTASVCETSTIYPGVAEFMAACKAQGITLACVTNKPYAPARGLLEALNLLDDFALLIGGDTLPHRKPHPEPLLHCLHHFEVAVADALMVGDSRNDVEAARAAHMKVVALSYGYNHGEPIADSNPDWLVDSLASLI